ncbi:MAG TPA: hypothetical protein VGY14_05200 [Methyloceanibacter sp.]|jgi:hypothetical protein|nr:hypothetical protein [Methyloceanibacter sp.]
MRSRSRVAPPLAMAVGGSLALLQGCSTVERVTGTSKPGATTDAAARYVQPQDPMARPIQVAWTSARATYCGFMFDPVKLKNDYMADESRRGTDPYQLRHLSEAYDYTLKSVTDTIKDDPKYCNKERTDAIRADLKRYLAGDYAPTAKLVR